MYDNYRHSVIIRILNNSIKQNNGCINYADTIHKYGLVSITINGKRHSVTAHRAMYMAENDCFNLPRNIVIRHKCDNPKCVNIEHLIQGSALDNMQDCIARGRRATKYKQHTRQRVVSDATIKAIRAESPRIKIKYIANKYGVSIGYVSKIRNNKAKTLV
jgi:hypothetical protein